MVKRVPHSLLADRTHPALNITIQHMGATWSVANMEPFLKTVSDALFPSEQWIHMWGGCNLTDCTLEKKWYYPITITLEAGPNMWFKNLRLLQLRHKLGLLSHLRLSMPSTPSGQLFVKMDTLKTIVGDVIMKKHETPKLRKIAMMTTQPHTTFAAESSRSRGLAARERRG